MSERYDSYMCIISKDSHGNIVSEHRWKLRCPDLLGFTKAVHALYLEHHPNASQKEKPFLFGWFGLRDDRFIEDTDTAFEALYEERLLK